MSKQKFDIPIVFKVKANSELEARAHIERLMRHGFDSICEYEQPTWKAIKRWQYATIRRVKI